MYSTLFKPRARTLNLMLVSAPSQIIIFDHFSIFLVRNLSTPKILRKFVQNCENVVKFEKFLLFPAKFYPNCEKL